MKEDWIKIFLIYVTLKYLVSIIYKFLQIKSKYNHATDGEK